MGSIQKIVSTPVKWVFKKVIHQTLLKFPGGNPQSPVACVYCPEMCRFSCPTAVASGNDAVTPSNKMSLLYKEWKWPCQVSQGLQLWPIYDCTGCGRCTKYCVYEMPVADRLFQARRDYAWDRAREVSREISDDLDPIGDLAGELGDFEIAEARLRRATVGKEVVHSEPKAVAYAVSNGKMARLSWADVLESEGDMPKSLVGKLTGKVWLVHESPWLNRHLKESKRVEVFFQRMKHSGVQIVFPFEHGADCVDCGGEGAYRWLFPAQAKRMAMDIWERDRERVDGILCMSERCARHFRESVGSGHLVESIQNIVLSAGR